MSLSIIDRLTAQNKIQSQKAAAPAPKDQATREKTEITAKEALCVAGLGLGCVVFSWLFAIVGACWLAKKGYEKAAKAYNDRFPSPPAQEQATAQKPAPRNSDPLNMHKMAAAERRREKMEEHDGGVIYSFGGYDNNRADRIEAEYPSVTPAIQTSNPGLELLENG
jgi:hypothetical protein